MSHPAPATLTFAETDAFYRELDRLIVRRRAVTLVVPVPPAHDSAFYVRIRRCKTAAASAEPGVFQQADSVLSKPNLLIRLFHVLYRKPNYFAYEAQVCKDLDPLEVHLKPL